MGTKIKGVFKSFKYISQIFVVKEREMDIGYPTDVKHVAHIGWDGQQTSAPSWMNEFKSDFSASSLSNLSETKESNRVQLSSWSSQDFEQSSMQTASDIFRDEYFCTPPTDLPKAPKKHKRKKTRSSTSSPRSSSTSRSSRGAAAGAATTSRASAFSTEVYMTPNAQGVVAIP